MDRLSKIERALASQDRGSTSSSTIDPALAFTNLRPLIPSSQYEREELPNGPISMDSVDLLDPIKTFRATIASLQALTNEAASALPLTKAADGGSSSVGVFETDFPHLDAIHRAILSEQDAEALFEFFYARCAPWVPIMDIKLDRNVQHVRKRSPILFHAICAVAAYYSSTLNARCLAVYTALVRLLDELLGHTLLAPKAGDLTVDFVKAVIISNLYKPIQSTPGMPLSNDCHVHSKVNDGSSYLLNGLAAFLAHRVSLNTSPNSLMAFHPDGPTVETISACRCYYGMIIMDSQASLQSGRIPNSLEIEEALKSARVFANLNAQPSDARIAATLELFSIARRVAFLRLQRQDVLDIAFIEERNLELDRWHSFWQPLFRQIVASGGVEGEDSSIKTMFNFLYPYIRFRVNSFGLRFWLDARNSRPFDMSTEARKILTIALSAVEELCFKFSVESWQADGSRAVTWPPTYEPSRYPALNADMELAQTFMTAPDTYLSVMATFPVLFATKLFCEGLLTLDMEIIAKGDQPVLYEAGCGKDTKICRLILLAADFLDLASPNPDHFCKLQSKVLRKVREVLGVHGPKNIAFASSTSSSPNMTQVDDDLLSRFLIGDLSGKNAADIAHAFENINSLMGWDLAKHLVALKNN
ncbi:hypothetical protein BT69DRAFT_1331289 [Atractiella rhizophila]|nr:hypothetical protein BT69DRAFT_1331289 [Atractiella rhizophila]